MGKIVNIKTRDNFNLVIEANFSAILIRTLPSFFSKT